MEYPFFLIWLLATLAIIIGLIRPSVVLRWGNKRTRKRVVLIYGATWFFSLIAFGALAPSEQERNRAKAIDEFGENRTKIIENAEVALAEGKYRDLILETEQYLVVNDSVLNRLRLTARKELKRQETAERSEEILTELKAVPAQDYKRNIALYEELTDLLPDSSRYKSKLQYYREQYNQQQIAAKAHRDSIRRDDILSELKTVAATDYARNLDLYGELLRLFPEQPEYKKMYKQIQEWQEYDRLQAERLEKEHRDAAARKEAEEKAQAQREEKIKAQFSAWDGSHYNLERLIKQGMNDPDSYKHVETVYWDMGTHLVVRTTFRGKNAFGGVVLNYVKAKVDFDGNVIEIMEWGP